MSVLPRLEDLDISKFKQPYDTIAKRMPVLLPSLSAQLNALIARALGPLPTELKVATQSKLADLVLEASLHRPLSPRRPGEPEISTVWFLVEGVDQIRPEKLSQILDYWLLLLKENGFRIPVIPCLLIIKDIPMADRDRELDAGWDLEARPMVLRVAYIDEIDVMLLSPHDQAHPAAKMFGIMKAREEPRESIRIAYMAILEWSKKSIVFDLLVLLVCVCIRCRCLPVLSEVMAEVRMSDLNWMGEQERREWSAAVEYTVANMPGFEEMMKEKFVKPAKEEGLEKGLEKGKHETHVNALLKVLRRQSIELSASQKAALRQQPCERLPDLDVAFDASDADDFMRRAGLHSGNGGGNGHG